MAKLRTESLVQSRCLGQYAAQVCSSWAASPCRCSSKFQLLKLPFPGVQAPRGRPRLSCAHKGFRSVPKSPASGLSCSFARDLPRIPVGLSRLGPLQTSRFRPRTGSRGRLSIAALGAGGGPGSPSEPPASRPGHSLTRLGNVRRDRAGDASPQDDVQRPQAP